MRSRPKLYVETPCPTHNPERRSRLGYFEVGVLKSRCRARTPLAASLRSHVLLNTVQKTLSADSKIYMNLTFCRGSERLYGQLRLACKTRRHGL